jgi:hypothetical protein
LCNARVFNPSAASSDFTHEGPSDHPALPLLADTLAAIDRYASARERAVVESGGTATKPAPPPATQSPRPYVPDVLVPAQSSPPEPDVSRWQRWTLLGVILAAYFVFGLFAPWVYPVFGLGFVLWYLVSSYRGTRRS